MRAVVHKKSRFDRVRGGVFMKKTVFALVAIAVVTGSALGSGALAQEERKGPKIEVKEERYNFGKVTQGEEAVHVFEIRNAGDEPLVIERVQTS